MAHPFQSSHPQGLHCSGFRDGAGGCSTPPTPPPIALGLLAGGSAIKDVVLKGLMPSLNFVLILGMIGYPLDMPHTLSLEPKR